MRGKNAVKADEEKGWARGGVRVEQGNQFKRQAARVDQVAGATGIVKGREPAAECCRILLPGGAGGGAQEPWLIGTEQFMGFHGQAGQAMTRPVEQSGYGYVRACDASPERLLLYGVQLQAAIERTVFPGGADKAIPVQDVGRRPGGDSLGAAGAVKGGRKGARGPLAGRNHKAASAQPCVHLSSSNRPHSSVIRRGARGMPVGWPRACFINGHSIPIVIHQGLKPFVFQAHFDTTKVVP